MPEIEILDIGTPVSVSKPTSSNLTDFERAEEADGPPEKALISAPLTPILTLLQTKSHAMESKKIDTDQDENRQVGMNDDLPQTSQTKP